MDDVIFIIIVLLFYVSAAFLFAACFSMVANFFANLLRRVLRLFHLEIDLAGLHRRKY